MIIKDVEGDGNCLLWAVMVSYLEQVKTDEKQFKERYKTLFGTESDWNRIFNFNDFDFNDNENVNLVKLFRNRIYNYIKENLDTERPLNKCDFRSMLLESEINKENKKLNPKDNEEKQLETTLEKMKKNGNYAGSNEIEAICNILNCNIIRTNETSDVKYIEKFEPDYVNTNDEIKLHYYENKHYKYSSNVINNRNEENISAATKQNYHAILNSYKQQLLSKDIDEKDCDAIINIFIEDLNKAPSDKQSKILEKSVFELTNQDKLLENPNLSFESCVKPIINNPKTSAQELSAFANANANQPFAIKVA